MMLREGDSPEIKIVAPIGWQREYEVRYVHQLQILDDVLSYIERKEEWKKNALYNLIKTRWSMWQENSSGAIGEGFARLVARGVLVGLPVVIEGDVPVNQEPVTGILTFYWYTNFHPIPNSNDSELKRKRGYVRVDICLDKDNILKQIADIKNELEYIYTRMDNQVLIRRMSEIQAKKRGRKVADK